MHFDDIRNISVIGAGTMGAGMGWCFALAGYNVCLNDVSPAQLEKASERIEHIRALYVQEGLATEADAAAAAGRIALAGELESALGDAQYVLEAVPERLDLKQSPVRPNSRLAVPTMRSWRATRRACASLTSPPPAGTRTSGGDALGQPARAGAAGRGGSRRADVRRRPSTPSTAWSERLGKMPVVVQRDIPGFASNRLQYAVLREALYLVASRCSQRRGCRPHAEMRRWLPVSLAGTPGDRGPGRPRRVSRHLHSTCSGSSAR